MDEVWIMKEKWDHLIILDACRFDYFEEVWKNHLTGELAKRLSVGSSTVHWRDKSFPDRYDDVVYISSNPYINSVMPVRGFLGSDHFHRVYDVWKAGWDENRGTVPPDAVTDAAIKALMAHQDKRTIVHYLQPHAPYLTLDVKWGGFPVPDLTTGRVLTGLRDGVESRTKEMMLRLLTSFAFKTRLLGQNPVLKLRELLRMEPASPLDAVRRKYGDSGLRKAYRANLELVLQQVTTLLRYMSGRIVVTSDHGEMLGEDGRYSHFGGSMHPCLTEIPWLVIDRSESDLTPRQGVDEHIRPEEGAGESGEEDEAKIKERLRGLGYTD